MQVCARQTWLTVFGVAVMLLAQGNAPLRAQTEPQVIQDCDDCPELVVVPAGSFVMGLLVETGEGLEHPAEREPQQITIARPFAIGKFELTRSEFAAFVDQTGYQTTDECRVWDPAGQRFRDEPGRDWRTPGFPEDLANSLPVTCVDWHDARAYAAWLSDRTGETYRLPSEAEWEYAAKAGTQTSRFWGDDPFDGCAYANTFDQSAEEMYPLGWRAAPCRDGYADLAPVGSFAPNGFGLHDMIGNVWEWAEDCSSGSYVGRPKDARAWVWEGGCERRIQRGGGWITAPARSRTAYHGDGSSTDRSVFFGFRIARDVE